MMIDRFKFRIWEKMTTQMREMPCINMKINNLNEFS